MKRWITMAMMLLGASPVSRTQPMHFDDTNLKIAGQAELGVTDPTAANVLDLTSLNTPAYGC